MLKYFFCPDGATIEVADCLNKCRMDSRCMTKPSLVFCAREREWTGEPSTTQMLNGTMYEYLKLVNDFGIKPQSKAFALLGTIHHRKLEEIADQFGLPAELSLTDNEANMFDLLEYSDDGEVLLTDYKTWGSFKVAKALGIVSESIEAGGKKKKRYDVIPSLADNKETELQLNRYRILLQDNYGIQVSRMQVQITVRDGGLWIAKNRGVVEPVYLIPIPMMPDTAVKSYFTKKQNDLLTALDQGHWEEPCSLSERWDDARCKSYCEVYQLCPYGEQFLGGE